MALVSGARSTLNPDAPPYIPTALRQVEDFSPEWWQLITTSTWYREHWLRQHQGDYRFADNENENDVADWIPDTFDLDPADDFASIEEQIEEFVRLSEAKEEQ